MDGVVHNPDILQVSNEADLSTGCRLNQQCGT